MILFNGMFSFENDFVMNTNLLNIVREKRKSRHIRAIYLSPSSFRGYLHTFHRTVKGQYNRI